ncbi:MAG: hypothetical protein R3F54_24335 [Alphaproteobacteria bacterium]
MSETGHQLRVVTDNAGEAAHAAEVAASPAAVDAATWAAVDWDDLVPRLLLLAMSRLSRMTWRGRRHAPPPGAAEAEDFVNEAIAKTMAGVRVWTKESCTLFQHLAGVVVSDISHAAEAAENRLTLGDGAGQGESEGWPPDQADERPDQEQQALWRSEQRRLLGYLDKVDPKLAQMAELILIEDIDASAALAGRLDCTVNEVANLRKRLKRSLRVYLLAAEGAEP